jgi:hypothetical protein
MSNQTWMDGPVTRAQAARGEDVKIHPAEQQPQKRPIEDEDGIKLRLDLNLDVEVELKAHIHGDLTLTLL